MFGIVTSAGDGDGGGAPDEGEDGFFGVGGEVATDGLSAPKWPIATYIVGYHLFPLFSPSNFPAAAKAHSQSDLPACPA